MTKKVEENPAQIAEQLLEKKIPKIKRALDDKENLPNALEALVAKLHSSELAQIIQYLEAPYREEFILRMKPINPEIFLFLDEHIRGELIELLSDSEISEIFKLMESDDSFEILSSLDAGEQKRILHAVPSDTRKILERMLRFPKESAGRIMQKEVLALPQDRTVQSCLEHIAKEDVPTNFYDVIIVDASDHPVGIIPLSKLLKNAKKSKLKDVMDRDVRVISALQGQEEVAFLFRAYDLTSAPVVDKKGKLIGMITIDDVIDVIEQEAEEDIMYMGGITSSDFYIPILKTSLSRIHWLIVSLLNTLLCSLVIQQFEGTFAKKAALTILMPIASSMGGNAGTQAVTVTIRALATRELSSVNVVRATIKETVVALFNGSIISILLFVISFLWFYDWRLSTTLSAAVLFNTLWAGLVGAFLPTAITRMGGDPALSAGPLLATITDVFGYAAFLWIAYLIMF